MKNSIYLDNNANTPVDPRVAQKIIEYLQVVGNPSSTHHFGKKSLSYLTKARDTIAAFLKARPEEIIFTSGGTEAANMVIRGLFEEDPSGHIITSLVEHSCVFKSCQLLESKGVSVSYLPTGIYGAVTPQAVKDAIRPETRLIALMSVNNETGVKTDIEAIAKIAHEANIPFFVDAIAQLGREPIILYPGLSAMAFSGQKIHATKGVGFCFIKRNLKLSPLIIGGPQQFGRRGGTENLPGIAGLGEAIQILMENQNAYTQKMAHLRERFESQLKERIPGLLINGEGPRTVNTSNLSFPGIDGETLLIQLDREGIAASHGSACSSGALEPSRVLMKMGYPLERVKSSIRFSFSRNTTEEEISTTIELITSLV